MRSLFVICTIALILGVNSANVGICQFDTEAFSGSVIFTEDQINYQSVIKVSGTITGPAAAKHGLHIHEFGDIRDNIGSAGTHFNPYNNTHNCGPPTPTFSHLGDLGNIEFKATAPGITATIDKTIIGVDLHSPDVALIGRTVVIHANEDKKCDGTNLGDRVAQCVIGYKEGEVGYPSSLSTKATPQAICVLEGMELQIIFKQDDDLDTIVATVNVTNYENDIFLSTEEAVNTISFNDAKAKILFDTSKPSATTVVVRGLSIRISATDVVNIIGKAVYCVDTDHIQHSCVIGFYNSAYLPPTSSSTITTADPIIGSTTTAEPTTGSTTGDATTGDATTTTTGDSTTGNATSTIGSSTTTNTTTDASTPTSGQVVNPALNTTDTSGGAVLGIIFATFILLGLAWYTYVNRGNNQRRIGYFGV